jgi:hypothetical protein
MRFPAFMAAIAAVAVILTAHVDAGGAVLVDASWSVTAEESVERRSTSGGKKIGTPRTCADPGRVRRTAMLELFPWHQRRAHVLIRLAECASARSFAW